MTQCASGEHRREVDPWKFTGSFLKNLLCGMIPDKPSYSSIPWTPPRKRLSESKVAMVSTAGISMKGDPPFDMESERKNPLHGDSSWRRLSAGASAESVEVNHLHIDTSYIKRDLNVALPLARLAELVEGGRVGAMAATHYSVMGYQGNDSSKLENESAPAIARSMLEEEVDLALLAPV